MLRRRRERPWLQMECLRKLVARSEHACRLIEHWLISQFGMTPDACEESRRGAATALIRPALRDLDAQWSAGEMSDDEYQRQRLLLEYQHLHRRLHQHRARLEQARREFELAGSRTLQDHELGQICGIPAGALMARKIKFLQQYLQALHARLAVTVSAETSGGTPPLDLWKETFAILSRKPVERSVGVYEGLEGSEAALIDKLTALATGALPEDAEARLWQTISQETSPQTEYGNRMRSLFPLQRLFAILTELENDTEALEQELRARTAPPRPEVQATEEPRPAEQPQLGEMAEHVLRSFMGEDRR